MSNDQLANELIELNERLLRAIAKGDWNTYQSLCDSSLSCFEPEARGHLVEGMDFHQFYFDLGSIDGPRNTTLCAPHVRIIGDAAIVSFVRLVQRLNEKGDPVTAHYEETRVWEKHPDGWKHVHFHRSVGA